MNNRKKLTELRYDYIRMAGKCDSLKGDIEILKIQNGIMRDKLFSLNICSSCGEKLQTCDTVCFLCQKNDACMEESKSCECILEKQ